MPLSFRNCATVCFGLKPKSLSLFVFACVIFLSPTVFIFTGRSGLISWILTLAPVPTSIGPTTLSCPSCSGQITINTEQRPIQVGCPMCQSQFIIREISQSRKEIRLLAKTADFSEILFDESVINNFNIQLNRFY